MIAFDQVTLSAGVRGLDPAEVSAVVIRIAWFDEGAPKDRVGDRVAFHGEASGFEGVNEATACVPATLCPRCPAAQQYRWGQQEPITPTSPSV